MARALLQGADMAILDESFGALDPATLRRCLQTALDRAGTLMVIAPVTTHADAVQEAVATWRPISLSLEGRQVATSDLAQSSI